MNQENAATDNSPARKGKIARLPPAIREHLNRRLQNGEEGKKLVGWLDSLPIFLAFAARFLE